MPGRVRFWDALLGGEGDADHEPSRNLRDGVDITPRTSLVAHYAGTDSIGARGLPVPGSHGVAGRLFWILF